ncbi:MAG: DEAD/DEAH box helicase family protein, partial [Planctomycetes bacterium]|nr:DEAD/DEAH box helicase family protein [Planctomycetota bacterium]
MESVALLEPPVVAPLEETEAYQNLLARAHRKTGAIPADAVVKHVLSVTRDADWPVQREALEALLRRFSFGQKDRLKIASRPAGLFGLYTTRREGSSSRPYNTFLASVEPPRGSCDCPDFLRSSLGLCKHLLAVIEDALSRPRRTREESPPDRSPLAWHPVRALTGPGDWMEQIRWARHDGTGRELERFRRTSAGEWVLRETCADDPRGRLSLVRELAGVLGRHDDPALRALLAAEERRLDQGIRDAEAASGAAQSLRTLHLKLYPYQEEGVQRFLTRGRLLLADDMGLGKTAQAIAACHALWHSGRARRGLLIVPAALKPQWLREWQIFTDVPARVVDGNPADRRKAFESCTKGFLIANYEQLLRDLEVMHAWKPDLVVLDEAQRIKNWATKTAAYVKKLQPPYRLVLTGTPMENRLDELASIMDWVDDFALEPKWRLVPWHTVPVDGKKEIGGARNLDTLRCRLAGSMIRRLWKDVLGQLPARTDSRIPVEMTPEQTEEHDALTPSITRLIFIGKKRPLTQAEFLRLMSLLTTQRIISNGLAQLRFEEVWPEISGLSKPSDSALKGLSSPKLLELRELIAQLVGTQKRKVVVFS